MASEDAYKNEAQRRRADFRGRDLRRAPDFARRDFLGFSAAASSRRRLAAQLGLLAWRPRAMASASAGAFSVMTDPAAMLAPSPMAPGATHREAVPVKDPLPA